MIKLFSLKQQQKDGEQTSKSGTNKKTSPAQLRIQKGSFNLLLLISFLFSIFFPIRVRCCLLEFV